MTERSHRPHVLMLAYACGPDEGSEPEVGWRWAQVMSKSCEITLITQTKNRHRIDRWDESHAGQGGKIRFRYLELGPLLRWVKKHMPGGLYLYYVLWQWKLKGEVRAILGSQHVDLIHHVTFASFRLPVMAGGKRFVWGPVGGAEIAPMHLLSGHGTLLGRLRERVRNFNTRVAGKLVRIWDPTRRNGGMALASTPATSALLARNGIVCKIMPTIGYHCNASADPRDSPTENGRLRILYVGRLHLLKGLHLLLLALARIGDDKVTLTIVGDGPERRRLARLSRDLGLDRSVDFRGHVARESLADIFDAHDLLAAPSLYESGGLSVLEGFAHGLPAVVLDCGGHAMSVDAGCGIRISTGRSQAEVVGDLADAILAFHADRDFLHTCGRNARRKVETDYSWNHKHDVMRSIYQRVIDGAHDAPNRHGPAAPCISTHRR